MTKAGSSIDTLSYSRKGVRFVMRLTNDKRRFSLYSHVFVEHGGGGPLSAVGADGCLVLYKARV